MTAYPKYKPSGIEWIGDIPSHWEICRLKFKCNIQNGFAFKSDEFSEEGIPIVRIGDVKNPIDLSQCKKTVEQNIPHEFQIKAYDILIALSGATVGKMCFVDKDIDAYINQRVASFNNGTKFLYYTLISDCVFEQIRLAAGGSAQENISTSTIGSFFTPIPPLPEQTAIANYLDKKTAEIDELIEGKQKLIELLKEERTAIINQAVTKGINPKVKLKPSGIEWLGDIPAHWEVKKLKYISPKISVGLVINPSTYFDENGTIPMLTGRNISPYQIDISSAKLITESSNQILSNTQLHEGDIVVVRVGYPGIAAVVPKEIAGANCASMAIIRKGTFNSDFFCFCFNSTIGKSQVEIVQYGAAQKQFNISHATEFMFPVPPINEQSDIATFIKQQTAKIEATIATIEKEIELMHEYRTALISEVVTGKVKVV